MSVAITWLCVCGLPTMNGPRGKCAVCAREEEPRPAPRIARAYTTPAAPLVPVGSPRRALAGGTRARTISVKRLGKRELERGRLLYPDLDVPRPATRADCIQGVNELRPCPFVSCKYHLFLDVSPRSGAIKVNFPHLEVHEMGETCTLDVADRGGAVREEIAPHMNLTRERVRQLETRGVAKLKALAELSRLAELAGVPDPHAEPRAPAETQDRESFVEELDTRTYARTDFAPAPSSAEFFFDGGDVPGGFDL